MRGLGSAALAAARLFGGIEKGKLQGAQRAREEVNARKAEEEAERRAMLDEMVKRSTHAQNQAQTAEITKRTAAAPGSFAEVLARESAGRAPTAPRNIDPLSPEGIEAARKRASVIPRNIDPLSPEGIDAAGRRRVDGDATDARATERERRAYIAKTTREYMQSDPRTMTEGLKFSEAKIKAEQEAREIYGDPKQIGDPRRRLGDPVSEPSVGIDVQGETLSADGIVMEAAKRIREGKGTLEQAKEVLSPERYQKLEGLMGRKKAPASPPLRGADRF